MLGFRNINARSLVFKNIKPQGIFKSKNMIPLFQKNFSSKVDHHQANHQADHHNHNNDSHDDHGHDDHGHHEITGEVDLNKIYAPMNSNVKLF